MTRLKSMLDETGDLEEFSLKQRIITGVIGIILFAIVLFFYETPIFDIAICAVCLIGVHEMLMAKKITKNIPISVVAIAMAILPFLRAAQAKFLSLNTNDIFFVPYTLPIIVYFIFIVLIIAIFLKYHETLSFEKMASAVFIALGLSLSFSSLLYIRNAYGRVNGLFYTIIIFICAWGSDTGAYFTGRLFGKHKLAPKISPNKTVEGLIGGAVSCVILNMIAIFIYQQITNIIFDVTQYLIFFIISIVGSFVGVIGDLSASAVKRQSGIKDFGTIMPGHGGVLDRFDSVLFVAPFLFLVLKLMVK